MQSLNNCTELAHRSRWLLTMSSVNRDLRRALSGLLSGLMRALYACWHFSSAWLMVGCCTAGHCESFKAVLTSRPRMGGGACAL